MKICFVVGYPKYCMGGSELQAYLLAKELLGHEEEVHFAFEDFSEKIEQYGIYEVESGITIHRFKLKKIFRILNFWRLYSLLKEIDADIYYNRVLSEYTGMTAYFCKKKNKKFIWACAHDRDCYAESNFSEAKKYKINILKKLILLAYTRFKDSLCTYGMKNADKIITQSIYQADLLKQNFGLESIVIPNSHPIPNNNFKKEHPQLIVWIANIKKWKHPEIFIDLAKACHDLDVKFIFAGMPANNAYQDMLMSKQKKSSNIRYLGQISFENTNELLSKASIFVNTSLFEGFPNTFIQAWLRETPVVSLNVDPDDILKRYKIGFHSKTFEQLVKDVRLLIENENLRKEMGKRAREYAAEHHDIEKIGEKYLEVFEKLMEK